MNTAWLVARADEEMVAPKVAPEERVAAMAHGVGGGRRGRRAFLASLAGGCAFVVGLLGSSLGAGRACYIEGSGGGGAHR
jgi:hypothetical protein